jgi:hypothetical protein
MIVGADCLLFAEGFIEISELSGTPSDLNFLNLIALPDG